MHDPHYTGLRSCFTQASSHHLQNPKSKKHTALHTRNQSKECLEEGGDQHVLKLRLSNNSLIVEQRPATGSSNQADYGYPYLTEGGSGSIIDKSVRLTHANENPYYDSHKEEEGLRSTRKGQQTLGQRSM